MSSENTQGTRSRNALFPVLMFLLAIIIAASGSMTLPMDGHETFVVQTTQEMHDRNDWIVPWFNGEPRLNKPPLNYWITGATAWMSGSLDHIGAWHGRFASILAALGMAILTFIAGTMLYGRRVAVLAASFLVTSLGYFNYSHDARPDMLYAALCTAGYVAFIFVWKADGSRKWTWSALLMWAAYALATLSKGPHMPAMYLVASIVFCCLRRMSAREIMGLFRPVAGLILYAVITLPWWYFVQSKLGGTSLHSTQLGGSLLTVRFDQFFNLYYFYRPLILVLPWLIFLPHTILHFRHRNTRRDSDTLLVLYILVPASILSFGSQERWFYMLPSLPPMIILLATGADYMLEQRKDPPKFFRLLLSLCLATGIAYAVAGFLQAGWSKERFELQKLSQHALTLMQPAIPVYTLDLYPDAFVYYLHTRIMQEKSMDAIMKNLATSGPGQALVIMNTFAVKAIPKQIPYRIIYTTQGKQNKTLTLVILNPSS